MPFAFGLAALLTNPPDAAEPPPAPSDTVALYSLRVDTDNDGEVLDEAEELINVTLSSAGIRTTRGLDVRSGLPVSKAGTLDFELDNQDGSFNPSAPATVKRGQLVRLQATQSGTTYPLWEGYVEDAELLPEIGEQAVRVPAFGVLSRFAGKTISSRVYADIRIDEAIHAVLDLLGWPSAKRDIGIARQRLDWWWLDNEDGLEALRTLTHTEGGQAALFESPSGQVVFRSRHWLRERQAGREVQSTLNGVTTEPVFSSPFRYTSPARDVVNVCQYLQEERDVGEVEVVWELSHTLNLGPNETRTLRARTATGDPFVDAETPTSPTDYRVTAGSLASAPALDEVSGAEVGMTLTAGPDGATVADLQLRAKPLTVARSVSLINSVQQTASIAANGRQDYRESVRPEIPVTHAQGFCDLMVDLYASGRRFEELTVVGNRDPDTLAAVLRRDVGDRVRAILATVSLDDEGWVRDVEHYATEGGQLHVTTFTVELEGDQPRYFLIGTSEIGGPDRLAPF